ncbi:MAG TPA: hypothetical protein VFS33_04910 [Gemmatimonadales bacterium]|nr:hypothetical protein [Gemmatimonadales bacterium]
MRIRIVAGANGSDTAFAKLSQALVVEVTDNAGRPAPGLVVRFEGVPYPQEKGYGHEVWVMSLSSPVPEGFIADTTDAQGQAAVLIQMGRIAGAAHLRVTVPKHGLTAQVDYTVLPGAPVRVRAAPVDTGVYVGSHVQLRGAVLDQHDNARSDPVTYTAGSTVVSVTSSGLVEGLALGRGDVVVHAGDFTDTTKVSVVPRGMLAAHRATDNALVLFNLDGSGVTSLTTIGHRDGGAAVWAPSGDRLALGTVVGLGLQIFTVPIGGAVQPLVQPVDDFESQAWPHYSWDGQWIYFSGTARSGPTSLWRAKSDGTGAERLWPDPINPCCGLVWRPSPSPDGSRLAYVEGYGAEIRVLDIATRTPSSWSVPGQIPRWSPTRDLIAFVAPYGGALSIMDGNGNNVRRVSAPGQIYWEGLFSWSPDGAWLAARSLTSIELLNIDTGLVIPLGYTTALDSPSWRPETGGTSSTARSGR